MADRLERFSSMSVLVVDDDEVDVTLLQALLSDEGLHRVTTEVDPRRVAALLPVVDPDLVLLDLRLPPLEWHLVLQQVARFAAGTYLPVLVLTADMSLGARDRALANGARDILTKPFDTVEVALRVSNLLETRQLYTALRDTGPGRQLTNGQGSDETTTRDRVLGVLRDRSITPVFHAVVDLDGATTVGYEALARFPLPHERGPAGWFLDADTVHLGPDLEWLAASSALPFLDLIPDDTFLAVNMSPGAMMELPHRQLIAQEMCPQLVIELTEHVPIEDCSALHRTLRELRDAGARLAADDLGSGYAGFRHLVALEPDIIKLDISVVNGIHRTRGQRALAKALVAFASDVGARVVAEGVEDGAEVDTLRELGVSWAQGFFFGQPEPAELAAARG